MRAEEFRRVRRHLDRTQSQLAGLLGLSPKAVQSFEQGWRRIPAHTERQLFYLVFLTREQAVRERSCWAVRECEEAHRLSCPAWQLGAGSLCWLTNGTFCRGKVRSNWAAKMRSCRRCEFFQAIWK